MRKGWEIQKMKEVCELVNGRAYKQDELLKHGKYRVLRVGNFFTNKDWYYSNLELPENKYCDIGDLLYAWSASFGPRIWKEEKVIYHYHIWKVIPNEKYVTKDFLFKLLEWDVEKIKEDHGTGTTMMHVSKGSMDERELPIPPLSEQKRIVTLLDEAFSAIDKAKVNTEKNLQNAKELFESYLQNVFANPGEDWEEKRLADITEVKDGTHDSPKYIKEGIPFVTQKNIRETGLTLADTRFITKEDHDKFYKRSNVAYGDIIISMIGANRGMSCIVDNKRVFSIKNVGLIKKTETINQNYLLYFLKSPIAVEYVAESSNGGAQEFVGLTALRNFPVWIAPKRKQDIIVSNLNALSTETKKLETIYQQKLNDLEELKKSILQKAFKGELLTKELV